MQPYYLGRTGIIKHKIPTGDALPIKQPLRRLPEHMHEEVNTQIDDMLQKDVIQPSSSHSNGAEEGWDQEVLYRLKEAQ